MENTRENIVQEEETIIITAKDIILKPFNPSGDIIKDR